MEISYPTLKIIEKENPVILNFVCEITPEKDERNLIIEYDFDKRIDNKPNIRLNQYGRGPFCFFSIPAQYSNKSGVYFIFENNYLRYIGETENLGSRFNNGYGTIDFRNCLHDGQSTNCRINYLILESYKQENQISLYFYETIDRKNLETTLLIKYQTLWNKKQNVQSSNPTSSSILQKVSTNNSSTFNVSIGKYWKLFDTLNSNSKTNISLSYQEIEKILDFKLPPSAYKHRPWWANDKSHTHAKAWLNAGWKVDKVILGSYVLFFKNKNVKI